VTANLRGRTNAPTPGRDPRGSGGNAIPGTSGPRALHCETFDQPDSTVLGPNMLWTNVSAITGSPSPGGDFETVSGELWVTPSSSVARPNLSFATRDVYAQMDLEEAAPANNTGKYVFIRGDQDGTTPQGLPERGYLFGSEPLSGPATHTWVLRRFTGTGGFTLIDTGTDSGSTYRIEANGTAIECFIDGVSVATDTDATTYGNTVGIYAINGEIADDNLVGDNFCANDLGAPDDGDVIPGGGGLWSWVLFTPDVAAGTTPVSFGSDGLLQGRYRLWANGDVDMLAIYGRVGATAVDLGGGDPWTFGTPLTNDPDLDVYYDLASHDDGWTGNAAAYDASFVPLYQGTFTNYDYEGDSPLIRPGLGPWGMGDDWANPPGRWGETFPEFGGTPWPADTQFELSVSGRFSTRQATT
jgi:hypothetical protein